jgi:hypothetical protein
MTIKSRSEHQRSAAADQAARDEILDRRPDLKDKSLEAAKRILTREARTLLAQRTTAVTNTSAEEYRRLARECLTIARTVSTEELRASVAERAEFLLRLAKKHDEQALTR